VRRQRENLIITETVRELRCIQLFCARCLNNTSNRRRVRASALSHSQQFNRAEETCQAISVSGGCHTRYGGDKKLAATDPTEKVVLDHLGHRGFTDIVYEPDGNTPPSISGSAISAASPPPVVRLRAE
jgi:hypothetical protein